MAKRRWKLKKKVKINPKLILLDNWKNKKTLLAKIFIEMKTIKRLLNSL